MTTNENELSEQGMTAFDESQLEAAFQKILDTVPNQLGKVFTAKPSKRARLMGTEADMLAVILNKRIHAVLELSYDSQNDILEIAR